MVAAHVYLTHDRVTDRLNTALAGTLSVLGGVVTLPLTAAAYVVLSDRPEWHAPVARSFTVLLLSGLPGLLYLRFRKVRLAPLQGEYVLNLERLGLMRPGTVLPPDSLHRLRFQAHYGRWPAGEGDQGSDAWTSVLAVYVCTAVLVVGTTGVVWYPPVGDGVTPLSASLGFGFLGAYFFVISMLTRRSFQNDLRPAAFLAAAVRVITVLVLAVAVTPILPDDVPLVGAVAFTIGVFPTVALQLLRRYVARVGTVGDSLEPHFPLRQLDGIDIWTEARLMEVGIEDAQHLATASLIDVSLATRLPMTRLVDWVDQAMLLLHARVPGSSELSGTHGELRALGVRTASDLVDLVALLKIDLGDRATWPSTDDLAIGTMLGVPPGGPTYAPLLTRAAVIARALADEPNFQLVRNWKATAVPTGGAV